MIDISARLYAVETITHRNGTEHERQSRRQGHRIRIVRLAVACSLLAEYIDEKDVMLRTSPVIDWVRSDTKLTVWTKNSTYTFRKISEEETDE